MDGARLVRELSTDDGVFGRLLIPQGLWWYTMEDDWRNNAVGQSCIPLGNYTLVRTIYHKKQEAADPWWLRFNYETFEIIDVPGRTRILIHPANTEEDVEGCVGIGTVQGFTTVKVDEDTGLTHVRKRAVLQSRAAFTEFMRAMRNIDRMPLRVTGVVG